MAWLWANASACKPVTCGVLLVLYLLLLNQWGAAKDSTGTEFNTAACCAVNGGGGGASCCASSL